MIKVGSKLPDLALPSLPGGELQAVRARGRRAPIVVLAHGSACRACLAYLDALAAEQPAIQEWDGRVAVILPEPLEKAGNLVSDPRIPFLLLTDPEARFSAATSVEPPAIIIADQWGEVHLCESAGPEHRFIPPGEIAEWLRFLAVQCPECQGEAL